MGLKKLLIILGIILITGSLVFKYRDRLTKTINVLVLTDKTEYNIGETLKITIKNNLRKNICFSSCYPYYLEIKEGQEWKPYSYGVCGKSDIIEYCVNSRENKTFEIDLFSASKGHHRISIPVSFDLKTGEKFKEDKRFYSNEFEIAEKEIKQ